MIPLHTKGVAYQLDEVIVGRLSGDPRDPASILLDPSGVVPGCSGIERPLALLTTAGSSEGRPDFDGPMIFGVRDLAHLTPGDVVALRPTGDVNTLFRNGSLHNALFVTDRCNSNCLMCSQPPKNKDDLDFHFELNSRLIPLIPKDTPVLGMTGGEPTLLGWRLLHLLRQIGEELPSTDLQILSNGRAFAWPDVARRVRDAISSPTIFCVPLYSDYSWQHDYIVQARDAFAQTVRGLHNLARAGIRVEIRVVLHRQSIKRLVPLARFLHRNVPFAEHIALMGLEYTGYTPFNDGLLWLDPRDYQAELAEAVQYLDAFGMAVSLYNLPLCLLDEDLWPFARPSISDWKQEYQGECVQCHVIDKCGGLFATSKRHSPGIHAITS